ncbi:MAG: co-chaperone GroES [Candidatus Gracilibacteria bacterium]
MSEKKLPKLRPLEDRIVVEPMSEMETTASGIIIPDTVSKGKPKKGRVVAVGDGKYDNDGKRIPMDVKVGDVVLLEDWGATEVKIEGKELYVIDQGRVLAILE